MDQAWTIVRDLVAVAAEGTGAATEVVGLGDGGPRVEIRLRDGSLSGAPDSVTLGVWRGSDGAIDKLGTFTIAAADIATPLPVLLPFGAGFVWVAVESFVAGTAPKLTAIVEARPAYGMFALSGTAGLLHSDAQGAVTSSLVVDADVKSDAAIAGTKVSPDFGSQVVTTTGAVAGDKFTATTALLIGTTKFSKNAGTPESAVVGSPGDFCCDTTNGEVYVKKTGSATNTGWKLITHA